MNSHLFRINIVLIILYILLVVPLWSGFLKDSDGRLAFRGLSRMISTQRQEVQDRSKMIMLNVLMPKDFEGLVAFVTPGQRADNVDWIGYLSYFEFAASVLPVPLNADAYAMSGFCQFHQGKADEAVVSYTRALEINPIFVPTYYNLAVLRFRAGEYAQASELISRMLALNAELSFKVIASSKIYADIIGEVPAFDFTKTMAGLYVDALRILVASQYRIGQIDQMLEAIRYAERSNMASTEFFNFYAALGISGESEHKNAEYFLNQVGNPKSDFYSARDLSVRVF